MKTAKEFAIELKSINDKKEEVMKEQACEFVNNFLEEWFKELETNSKYMTIPDGINSFYVLWHLTSNGFTCEWDVELKVYIVTFDAWVG